MYSVGELENRNCTTCIKSDVCSYVLHAKKLQEVGSVGLICNHYAGRNGVVPAPESKEIGDERYKNMSVDEVSKALAPKQEVRAQVSGMYVVSAKRVRGPVKEMSKSQKRRENLLDKLR